MGEARRRQQWQAELQRIVDKMGRGHDLTNDEKVAIAYDDIPPHMLDELRAIYARGETATVRLLSAHAAENEARERAISEATRLGVPGPGTSRNDIGAVDGT